MIFSSPVTRLVRRLVDASDMHSALSEMRPNHPRSTHLQLRQSFGPGAGTEAMEMRRRVMIAPMFRLMRGKAFSGTQGSRNPCSPQVGKCSQETSEVGSAPEALASKVTWELSPPCRVLQGHYWSVPARKNHRRSSPHSVTGCSCRVSRADVLGASRGSVWIKFRIFNVGPEHRNNLLNT